MRASERVRAEIEGEIFDYEMLCYALRDYKKPRDAITRLIREESIIRVKKGLYVFGKSWRRQPLTLEPLANMIYGPSYISLDYALFYYGLIPEKVITLSSMTSKRATLFQTPVGNFEYVHIHPEKMAVGLVLGETFNQVNFMIASPEKALCDKLDRLKGITNIQKLDEYIVSGLRIEKMDLRNMRTEIIQEISAVYKNPVIDTLLELKRTL